MRIFIIGFCVLFIAACVNDKKAGDNVVVDSPDSYRDAIKNNIKKLEISNKTGYDTTYFEGGEKKLGGMLINGKREGLWTSWYPNGTVWSEGEFKNGVFHGKTITYFENGSKRYEGIYIEGKRAGKWFFWDENGKLTNEQDYTK